MSTILMVIEQKEFDRNVFITYSNDEIVGLNFHQGIGEILWDFSKPCPALTDIFERVTEQNQSMYFEDRINRAIRLYNDKFLNGDDYIVTLPIEQRDIIKKALDFYIQTSKKFNQVPTDTENFELYDAEQLSAMMNYDVAIRISKSDLDNFEINHGINFPEYN